MVMCVCNLKNSAAAGKLTSVKSLDELGSEIVHCCENLDIHQVQQHIHAVIIHQCQFNGNLLK